MVEVYGGGGPEIIKGRSIEKPKLLRRSRLELISFIFNPLSKVVSNNPRRLWEHHVETEGDDLSEKIQGNRQYDSQGKLVSYGRNGNLGYIHRRNETCTPLQAHLLEFNFGYRRLG